ncbi:MAG: ATP-grasp domain-containing protein [Gammaproteobacteria bacterium]|nr:ATP-grasp domain-containing protein [Gammaproteobacteria bacterium]MBL6819171.1 ATP-grasp domain-containing protein [Gammaproteobacteria bacterium]MBL6898822.1 ATP-grasp domain-containing protein [Gammaproteobacteria bacterium]
MKKILIFEYITGGGLIENKLNYSLLNEANIILDSLIKESKNTVHFFCDYRHKYKNNNNAILVYPNNKDIIFDRNFISKYDYFLPICPEIDLILFNYVKKIRQKKITNIHISDNKSLLIASDKLMLKNACNQYMILNPDSYSSNYKNNKFITKDRYGCGCNNISIISNPLRKNSSNMIHENYIPGKSYSVNLYIKGSGYKLISINQQHISRKNTSLKLNSIDVNIHPSFNNMIYKFIDDILNVIPGLRGFIGFDFIFNNNKIFLIEINPRFTTSMALIEKCKNNHILNYINSNINEQVGRICNIKI